MSSLVQLVISNLLYFKPDSEETHLNSSFQPLYTSVTSLEARGCGFISSHCPVRFHGSTHRLMLAY